MDENEKGTQETTPEKVKVVEEKKTTDKVEFTQLPSIEDFDEKLAMVDKAFEYLTKLREFALKNISSNHVVDESGKPYITEAAVNAFYGPFGIYEKEPEGFVIKDSGIQCSIKDPDAFKGEIKSILYKGIVGSKTLGIEASFEGGVFIDEKSKKFHDKDDFLFYMQKAKANWRGRSVRKLLAIDNLTWEELEQHGIKKADAPSVDRQKNAPTEDEKGMQDKITTWITDMVGKDKFAEKLMELTSFPDRKTGETVKGVSQVVYLKAKRLEVCYMKIKKLHDEFEKNMAQTS